MSKRIIAGALSVATAVSAFAVLAVPAFAANDPMPGWQKVMVQATDELILGGADNEQVMLRPEITQNATNGTKGMTVDSTEDWELEWQAVTGDIAWTTTVDPDDTPASSTTGAAGTYLTKTGFGTAGYEYVGLHTAIGADGSGNKWGVSVATSGVLGDPLDSNSYGLTTALTLLASGTAGHSTVTPTYAASTDGQLGEGTFFGVIYFLLSPALAP